MSNFFKNQRFSIALSLMLGFFFTQLQAQTCRDEIPASTPTERFALHGDGTVTDNQTSLMWQQCYVGQSGEKCTTDNPQEITFKDAFYWSVALTHTNTPFAGYSDWRLPNIKELLSIVEVKCHSPAINLTVFPDGSLQLYSYVWSSTPSMNDSSDAWLVDFNLGNATSLGRGYLARARLVRNGE